MSDDRHRLNGNVEKILQKGGDSRESLLKQIRDLLADTKATRKVPPPQEILTQ